MPKFNTYPEIGGASKDDLLLVWDAETSTVKTNKGRPVKTVDSIADLKAISVTSIPNGFVVALSGYYANGDGGYGLFYYSLASAAADNGGTIIQPTTGSGRWLRIYSGAINLRWFGAKGDGSNDYASIAAAISALPYGSIYAPKGDYSTSSPILVPSKVHIYGDGRGATTFTQTLANTILFDLTNASNSSVSQLSVTGPVATAATPIFKVASTLGFECNYNRLSDIDILSMGVNGIGIDMSSEVSNTLFNVFENMTISGGGAGAWGSKIGIRVGGSSGVGVIGTIINSVRVTRTNKGVQCRRCDGTRGDGCSFDDINGNEIQFDPLGTRCSFLNTRFEPDGVPAAYVDFGTSYSNYVDGIPDGATTSLVVNTVGHNNGWQGTDGSGSLFNENPNPQHFPGLVTFSSIVGYADGTGGTVTQLTNKSTNVTLNKLTGVVTMNNANLVAGTSVGFNILNSLVGADDMVVACRTAGTSAAYLIDVKPNGAGAIAVNIRNVTTGDLAEAVGIKFTVFKSPVA